MSTCLFQRSGRGLICTAFVLAPALVLLAGCAEARHVAATLSSSSKPYEEFLEDPAALTTIKTIAIFPFENEALQPGFDADDFANKLANQLAAAGKVRVIYPGQLLTVVDRENRRIRRHNAQLKEKRMLGLFRPEEEEARRDPDDLFPARGPEELERLTYRDPVRNREEAVRLARQAKADAVIVGEVTDFDPYMRPRLSVTMRLIATGNTQSAAQAIAELTQWGVPRQGTGVASGTIYIRQEMFDSSIGSVGLDVSKYGRSRLISDHPYDTEVFVRSMSHYYEVVTHQLAQSYIDARKKAIKEAEERARNAARGSKQDQDAALRRLQEMMERDSRIPDYENGVHDEAYFDQAFPDKRGYMAANSEDQRIQSWRDGPPVRRATVYERAARDMAIPENERGAGLEGYRTMVDSAFPDADAYLEANMGDNRDRSWRADYYNHANPRKSAPLYDRGQQIE